MSDLDTQAPGPDPILAAAVQKLQTAVAKARAQGITFAPDEIDGWLKANTAGKYGLKDAAPLLGLATPVGSYDPARDGGRVAPSSAAGAAAEHAADASTFGFGTKAIAALTSLLQHGNLDYYRFNLMAQRALQAQQQEEHPVASTAGDVAGGVASSFVVPTPGGAARTILGKTVQAAQAGAIGGGLQALGHEDNGSLGDKAAATAKGAVGGGLLGGTIGLVGSSALAALSPAERAAARMSAALRGAGGPAAVKAAADAAKVAGRGNDVMLADLNPHLQKALDFAANNDEASHVQAAEALHARQADMSSRLLGDAQQLTGNAHADSRLAELADARTRFAQQAYGDLENQNATIDLGAVQKQLKLPPVASALRAARMAGDLKAADPVNQALQTLQTGLHPDEVATLAARLQKTTQGLKDVDAKQIAEEMLPKMSAEQRVAAGLPAKPQRAITFVDAQQLKRALDGKIGEAYGRSNVPLAQQLTTVRDAVKNAIVNQLPEYAQVDAKYAGMKRLEEAVQNGVKAWATDDPQSLKQTVAALPHDELAQFRYGMAAELQKQLMGAQTNRDVATRLLQGGKTMQTKLETVFGSKQNFDAFMAAVKQESMMHRTMGAIGGSATHARGAAAASMPAEDLAGAMFHGAPALISAGKGALQRASQAALGRATAQQMTPQLLTQGSDAITRLLDQLGGAPSPASSLMMKTFPVAGSGLLNQLLNPRDQQP